MTALNDSEPTLLDHDLSHSHTERSMDPLEDNTQSEGDLEHVEEKRDQQKSDSHRTRRFLSMNRRRYLAAFFFLSIGGLFLFSGLFDVYHVVGLCAPLLAISIYFVCRVSFIHMPPDAENDGQFESGEEEEDFAPDTAMTNDETVFRAYVPTLCVSYIVLVLYVVVGSPQSSFLANIFSPYCFAAYFILTNKPEAQDRDAYELPQVGGEAAALEETNDRSTQGRELVHSTSPPPTETSPLLVRGIQVV